MEFEAAADGTAGVAGALASDAEVDRTSRSGIENESFNPSIDLFDKLAIVLNADVAEFLSTVQVGR